MPSTIVGPARRPRLFSLVAAVLLLAPFSLVVASCGGGDANGPENHPPANVALVSGDGQQATVGMAVANPLVVKVTDAEGQPVMGAAVVFEVTAGGGSVADDTVHTSASGQASLAGWTLGTHTGSNTLRARVGTLPAVTFSATGTPGAAARLVISAPPAVVAAGAAISPALQVEIRDAHDNLVTTAADAVTLAIGTNPSGGTLGGTKTIAAVGGVASFSTVAIDRSGTGYTLVATSGTLAGATSPAFAVDAPPTVVSTSPATGATAVATSGAITVTFSEPVNATPASFSLACPVGSARAFTLSASPATTFTLTPTSALPGGSTCRLTVNAAAVTDADSLDGPDAMAADATIDFTTRQPLALVDDDWSADAARLVTGNVIFESATAATPFGAADNDTLPPGATVSFVGTIVGGTATAGRSEQGGDVTMAASGGGLGRFTYDPPAGYEGTDRFSYVVTDGSRSDTAAVTVRVSGMIWFVDNTAGGCTTRTSGCGRLTSPYSTLAALQAENDGAGNDPAPGDNIFLYQRGTAYTGSVTLLAGQRLIGQDASASLSTITGIAPSSGSRALPTMLPGDATTTTITSATGAVLLGQNNTVRGLTLAATGAIALDGIDFGTLTLAGDVSVTGVGATALSLQSGTVSGDFASVKSSGGASGVVMTNVSTIGTVLLGKATDTLASTTSALVNVTGGNGSFVFPGVVTNTTTAVSVSVQNVAGGAITFTGPINPGASSGGGGVSLRDNTGGTFTFAGPSLRTRSSVGIELLNNTGATFAFTGGGLDVFGPQGSVPFTATGGGTLTVLDPANSNVISSLGATALNVDGMTLDAAGLNFRSVSASSATGGMASVSGIVVANPGGTGGLTISGNGSANSGGIINGMSGYGINVRGATTPFRLRLAWMNVASTAFGGLVTSGPIDAVVRRSNFANNSTGIAIDDGMGTGSTFVADTVTIGSPQQRAFAVTPRSGGPLTVTLRGSTIDGGTAASATGLVYVDAATSVNASFVGNTIRNGANSQFVLYAPSGQLLFQGNTVTGSSTADAVVVEPGASAIFAGTMTYDIDGNQITSPRYAYLVAPAGQSGSVLSGKIRNNTIGVAGVAGSCLVGINTQNLGTGTHTTLVTNNIAYNCDYAGYMNPGTQAGARLNATYRNNTFTSPRIAVGFDVPNSANARTLCMDVSANALTPTQSNFVGNQGSGTLQLPGYSGATTGTTIAADIVAYLRGRNIVNAMPSSVSAGAAPVIQGTAAGIAVCPQPAF